MTGVATNWAEGISIETVSKNLPCALRRFNRSSRRCHSRRSPNLFPEPNHEISAGLLHNHGHFKLCAGPRNLPRHIRHNNNAARFASAQHKNIYRSDWSKRNGRFIRFPKFSSWVFSSCKFSLKLHRWLSGGVRSESTSQGYWRNELWNSLPSLRPKRNQHSSCRGVEPAWKFGRKGLPPIMLIFQFVSSNLGTFYDQVF